MSTQRGTARSLSSSRRGIVIVVSFQDLVIAPRLESREADVALASSVVFAVGGADSRVVTTVK